MLSELSLLHHVACNREDSQARGEAWNNDTHSSDCEIEGALLFYAPFHVVNFPERLGQERARDLIIQVQYWT